MVDSVKTYNCAQSQQHEPNGEENGDADENSAEESLFGVLLRANFRWRWPAIVEIEGGSEEGERESADAEGKMRSTVAENHTGPTTKRAGAKPTLRLGLGTLTLRSRRRRFRPRIFLFPISSASVQRDHFIFTNTGFANGAQLDSGTSFQPLMQTRPTEQMSAERHDRVFGNVQANVAFESGGCRGGVTSLIVVVVLFGVVILDFREHGVLDRRRRGGRRKRRR